MKNNDIDILIKGLAAAAASSILESEDEEVNDHRNIAVSKDFDNAKDALDHARKIVLLRRGDRCVAHTEGGDIECLFVDIVTSGDIAKPLLLYYNEKNKCYGSAKIGEISAIDPL